MRTKNFFLPYALVLLLGLVNRIAPGNAGISEPINIGLVKDHIHHYFDSGTYEQEVACVANHAQEYLISLRPWPVNAAIVFDIDDTLLSTWPDNKENDFGYNKQIAHEWSKKTTNPAIAPMHKLYTFAKDNGLKIFIITGREKSYEPVVIQNLRYAGYDGWHGLYLRTPAYNKSTRQRFKRDVRKQLKKDGYHILVNIGDQACDLEGGYAQKTFKLPNPVYHVE